MIATKVQEELCGGPAQHTGVQAGKHQPILLTLLATELGVSVDQISDFELCLADYSPAVSLEYPVHFFLHLVTII